MARPSLCVLQVSGGEQVEGERKNSDNSNNLMKINKNMAKLDKNPWRDHYRLKRWETWSKVFVDFKNEVLNSRP